MIYPPYYAYHSGASNTIHSSLGYYPFRKGFTREMDLKKIAQECIITDVLLTGDSIFSEAEVLNYNHSVNKVRLVYNILFLTGSLVVSLIVGLVHRLNRTQTGKGY